MLHAIREIDRNGREIYKCPLCGHVFVNSKQYSQTFNEIPFKKCYNE
ncbi:hypothetical protein [Candidatus Nanopusillus massiliensis]|nr:hypothetical protein [Candidatus Nanopusillus massiliensis]